MKPKPHSITMAHVSIPKTAGQWKVGGKGGADTLKYSEQPAPEIGDNQVLVKREYPESTLLDGFINI